MARFLFLLLSLLPLLLNAENGHSSLHPLDFEVTLKASGVSAPIPLPIPKDTLSFQVMVQGRKDRLYLVERLLNPKGVEYVGQSPKETEITAEMEARLIKVGQYLSPNRSMLTFQPRGVGSFLFPNNPKLNVDEGQWTLTLGFLSPSGNAEEEQVKVRVLIKTVSGGLTGKRGVLPLHFYFTGAREWTKARVAGEDYYQQMRKELKRIYEDVGITIEIRSETDLDEKFQTVTRESINELFLQGQRDDGVNVFFVGDSDFSEGISGGIPGPHHFERKLKAGVIIPINNYKFYFNQNPGKSMGNTVAHECGHYLGLFHPVDRPAGFEFPDPIGDVKANDKQNVMSWDSVNASFSKGQKEILLRSPLVELIETK